MPLTAPGLLHLNPGDYPKRGYCKKRACGGRKSSFYQRIGDIGGFKRDILPFICAFISASSIFNPLAFRKTPGSRSLRYHCGADVLVNNLGICGGWFLRPDIGHRDLIEPTHEV